MDVNKNQSLIFLESCIHEVLNTSDEEIKILKEKYETTCSIKLDSNNFDFIPPSPIFKKRFLY